MPGADLDAHGRTSVLTGMVNALLDLDVGPGASIYAGGGVGLARVSMTIDQLGDQGLHLKDTDNLAWQVIAGIRTAVSSNLDAGLKYRFLSAGTLKGDFFGVGYDGRSSFQSHSIMASVIYNFRSLAAAAASAATASATSAAATGDADVPGRLGDPGDRRLPGAAASASAAATGARARIREGLATAPDGSPVRGCFRLATLRSEAR